jgi:hypothetical protein
MKFACLNLLSFRESARVAEIPSPGWERVRVRGINDKFLEEHEYDLSHGFLGLMYIVWDNPDACRCG